MTTIDPDIDALLQLLIAALAVLRAMEGRGRC